MFASGNDPSTPERHRGDHIENGGAQGERVLHQRVEGQARRQSTVDELDRYVVTSFPVHVQQIYFFVLCNRFFIVIRISFLRIILMRKDLLRAARCYFRSLCTAYVFLSEISLIISGGVLFVKNARALFLFF